VLITALFASEQSAPPAALTKYMFTEGAEMAQPVPDL
jgi:hypothetical protein